MTDFLFELPEERIARYPNNIRSQSRCMIVDPSDDTVRHSRFDSLLDFLRPQDLLVFNSSKVIPARLFLRKQTGGKVELLLERVLNDTTALVLLKSNKVIPSEIALFVDQDKSIQIDIKGRQQGFFVAQLHGENNWYELLDSCGSIPLPPYMQRKAEQLDEERYQTVYADQRGSVAAPTAGLHFDEHIFQRLEEKGVECAWLTLHIGYGTFAPLRDPQVDHLHYERFSLTQACSDKIAQAQERGGRVIAVGTTSCRVLETLGQQQGNSIKASAGETNLFIKPGFPFQCVDAMITNFHLPGSSLMYLVGAFAGTELIMTAYQQAIAEQYNFYSYGDCMFITGRGQTA